MTNGILLLTVLVYDTVLVHRGRGDGEGLRIVLVRPALLSQPVADGRQGLACYYSWLDHLVFLRHTLSDLANSLQLDRMPSNHRLHRHVRCFKRNGHRNRHQHSLPSSILHSKVETESEAKVRLNRYLRAWTLVGF